MTMKNYHIKALKISDWEILKHIRLEALQQTHGVFGGSYDEESCNSNEEWQHLATQHRFFTLLKNDQPVGLSALIAYKDHPEAILCSAIYINKDHRGQGLAKMLYMNLLNEAKNLGFKKAVSTVRQDNTAIQKVCIDMGFHNTHQVDYTWPDGANMPRLYFEKIL